jgi:tetratricopeptide (TPR) repeat protein
MLKINSSYTSQLIYGSLFFLILTVTIGLYWQGLQGLFIFDDEINLQNLADIGNGFNNILFFSLEGIAGPLGRPISLLTFALQADDWPYNPWHFKYINLMIHLLNGCLVFWFILSLTRLMALSEKRCLLLALLTTFVWLLHPLQVSTVLYVTQRMAQLSALFTLVGLLIYLFGRQLIVQNKLKTGFLWISVGVIFGGILATFSKENGILLVLYIIILEATVLRTLPKPRYWRIWSGIFLYLPLILLAFHFLSKIDGLLQVYEMREFTLQERLLTQARILVEYLSKIFLLHPYGFGLFHDDYPISHSLLTPPTTLIAVSFIIVMFGIAIWVRRLWPVLAFGVLWFLGGHILESSFIGLWLYFEHRNYLPMLGVIFATFYGIWWLFDGVLLHYWLRKIAIFFSLLWLAFFPLLTWSQTDIWGRPWLQTVFWAQEHPRSLAAQIHAVIFFLRAGEPAEAEKYIQKIADTFPTSTVSDLYLISLSCLLKDNSRYLDTQKIIRHFQTSRFDQVTPEILTFILTQREKGHCQLSYDTVDQMLNALTHNPNNAHYQAFFYQRYALFYASEKRYGAAVQALKQALELRESLRWRLDLIHLLMKNKQFEEAGAYLQETHAQLNPIKAYIYDKQLGLLEAQIPALQELHEMGIHIKEEQN